jgi:hypothetical protein
VSIQRLLIAGYKDKVVHNFPQFHRLHGFWQKHPNLNPHAVSTQPGEDLASDAMDLLFSQGSSSKLPDSGLRAGNTDDDADIEDNLNFFNFDVSEHNYLLIAYNLQIYAVS